ncbi:unnamed protein product [Bathycoccus prasinos]
MSFYAAEERERQKRAELSMIGALPPITPQKKDEREKQAPPPPPAVKPKLGSIPGVDYELLLQKFKLFDHDVQRYGPTAGLTRRERLESATARNQALDENALAVKHALESKIVDEENPTWKYSVWKNNPGLDVDF